MKKTIPLLILSLQQTYSAKERITAAWQMNAQTETASEAEYWQTSPYEYTPDDYYRNEADAESDFNVNHTADFSPAASRVIPWPATQITIPDRIPLSSLRYLLYARHNPER